MAGCLISGRHRWSVAYTSPTGRTSKFRIWNRRSFQKKKPYQFPGRMKNSSYYCLGPGREPTTSHTPRLHNKQGVPHPTCSASGIDLLLVVKIGNGEKWGLYKAKLKYGLIYDIKFDNATFDT